MISAMTREEAISILRAAMPGLRNEFAVESLYLFGSVARGDNRPDSDVDVLIEFAPGSRPTLFTLAGVYGRLVDLLGCGVDVGTLDSLRPAFRQSVEAEMLRVA
jgi:predicted nucleotidyltransferase